MWSNEIFHIEWNLTSKYTFAVWNSSIIDYETSKFLGDGGFLILKPRVVACLIQRDLTNLACESALKSLFKFIQKLEIRWAGCLTHLIEKCPMIPEKDGSGKNCLKHEVLILCHGVWIWSQNVPFLSYNEGTQNISKGNFGGLKLFHWIILHQKRLWKNWFWSSDTLNFLCHLSVKGYQTALGEILKWRSLPIMNEKKALTKKYLDITLQVAWFICGNKREIWKEPWDYF